MSELRPPLPPYNQQTAIQKVRAAEDSWNTCDPNRVCLAYSPQSRWRNRSEFLVGRPAIVDFLTRKWSRELDYRSSKSFGRSRTVGLPFALPTSGTTRAVSGSGRTATRTGTSTLRV